jgi:hypothetical protein
VGNACAISDALDFLERLWVERRVGTGLPWVDRLVGGGLGLRLPIGNLSGLPSGVVGIEGFPTSVFLNNSLMAVLPVSLVVANAILFEPPDFGVLLSPRDSEAAN